MRSEHCCVRLGDTPTCCMETWWSRMLHLSCPSSKPPRHKKATVVSQAVHQATVMELAVAQLQFGEAVNVRVVEQGFPLGSDDNEIDDLIVSLRPAANGILAKLNVEQILQACLES